MEHKPVDAGKGEIYLVAVKFEERVWAPAYGLTDFMDLFAWGVDREQAKEAALNYVVGCGAKGARAVSAVRASAQDLSKYVFVEQICGIPFEMATEAIQARRETWPSDVILETLATLKQRRRVEETGREMLAAMEV